MLQDSLWIRWWGPVLLVLCVSTASVLAQESVGEPVPSPTLTAQPSPSASVEPVVLPQTYRIKPNNMLVYQVRINQRSMQNPAVSEKIDRREVAIFDIDAAGQVVLYIGSPKETKVPGIAVSASTPMTPPTMPRLGHKESAKPAAQLAPATTSPSSGDTKPEDLVDVEMTWTKSVLGKPVARNGDGTFTLRPDGSTFAYPVLPMPPSDVKEKERFDVALPDIAVGQGKTLQMSGLWRTAGMDKIAVDAKLEQRITPGVPFVPDFAIIGFEFSRNDPAAVTHFHESRRVAGEPPSAATERPVEHVAEAPRPAQMPHVTPPAHHEGHTVGASKSSVAPKPVLAPTKPVAAQAAPLINVQISLEKSVQLSDQQHHALVASASAATSAAGKAPASPSDAPGVLEQPVGSN